MGLYILGILFFLWFIILALSLSELFCVPENNNNNNTIFMFVKIQWHLSEIGTTSLKAGWSFLLQTLYKWNSYMKREEVDRISECLTLLKQTPSNLM